MQEVIGLIVIIIATVFLLTLIYKLILAKLKRQHRRKQAQDIRFLQVRISKKAAAKNADVEATDHVQQMRNNIEVMNQIYKNFYSIFESDWAHKNLGNNYISIEMMIEKDQIKFILWIPKNHLETMEKMISSFYMGSVVEEIQQPKFLEAGKFMAGWEFNLTKNSVYPLKDYESFEADPMDSIMSAFNKVSKNDKLVLQILVQPLHERWLKKLRKTAVHIKKSIDSKWVYKLYKFIGIVGKGDEEKWREKKHKHDLSQNQIWDIDKKMEDELFAVKIRTFAVCEDEKDARHIISDFSRLFNQYNYVWLNSFKFNKIKSIEKFAKWLVTRNFYINKWFWNSLGFGRKTNILNIKELSSLIHFPHSRFNLNPRISWQNYKIVPAPDDMPTEWMLLWWNLYGWVKREVRLTNEDRFRHVYILWQTGTGKSTMILTQVKEDLKNGNGFCVIDPHGDLCEYALQHFPKERIDDLIYFDLANTEYPIAFNPLDGAHTDDERDVVTNDLVEMFVSMYWPEIFGPRIQDYFRNACFLLMEQPDGWTLVDIMRLFTDDAYAEAKIRNVKNPVIASWWNKTYKKMGDREKAEIIPFIQAKFGPFTTWTYIRNVIWQPKSAFNFSDSMQEGKIILCNLSKGLTWEENSKLIGKMVTMQIKLAALKRASLSPEDRNPYYLYIDEFQNYVSQSIESILSEARKYRLWLTIAHQYIDQLKQKWLGWELDLGKTIFGNVGTMFILKVGANDAEFLEKELSPEFNQSDIQSSETFKGIMKMSIKNSQSRPFSLSSKIPYKDPILNQTEKVEIIKQISALKWWTKRELVDKEVYFRVWV